MPPVGFESSIPASKQPQSHTLDRATRCSGFDNKLLTDLYLSKIILARCCFFSLLVLSCHAFPERSREIIERLLVRRRSTRLCRGWKSVLTQNLTTLIRMHLQNNTSDTNALAKRYVWFGFNCKRYIWFGCSCKAIVWFGCTCKATVWFGCTCKATVWFGCTYKTMSYSDALARRQSDSDALTKRCLIRMHLQSDRSDSDALARR
jgi:hypothetical protein